MATTFKHSIYPTINICAYNNHNKDNIGLHLYQFLCAEPSIANGTLCIPAGPFTFKPFPKNDCGIERPPDFELNIKDAVHLINGLCQCVGLPSPTQDHTGTMKALENHIASLEDELARLHVIIRSNTKTER